MCDPRMQMTKNSNFSFNTNLLYKPNSLHFSVHIETTLQSREHPKVDIGASTYLKYRNMKGP